MKPEFTKFVSEEIATARSRHFAAATATKHEPGLSPSYRVVLWLSTGGLGPPGEMSPLPACMQRRIRRGAAPASRLDPLAFSGDERGRCKALFFAVLNGSAISDPEPLKFS